MDFNGFSAGVWITFGGEPPRKPEPPKKAEPIRYYVPSAEQRRREAYESYYGPGSWYAASPSSTPTNTPLTSPSSTPPENEFVRQTPPPAPPAAEQAKTAEIAPKLSAAAAEVEAKKK